MKKILILFLGYAITLTACSREVTESPTVTLSPPTQTPIPTPTLHPQFEQLQVTVAQTEKFTLTSVDDRLLYDGSPVPGVTITGDGSVNLKLADGTVVTLDPSQVNFDDEAGFSADGYKLNENGEWVEAVNATQVAEDMLAQYNINPETVTVIEEGELVKVVDNATDKVLFETDGEQTKYGLTFAADTIAAASCEPTNIKPNHNGLASADNPYGILSSYLNPLTNDAGVPRWTGITHQYFLIDRAQQCWGVFRQTIFEDAQKDKVIIYRDAEKVVHVVPLLDEITWDDIYDFVLTR